MWIPSILMQQDFLASVLVTLTAVESSDSRARGQMPTALWLFNFFERPSSSVDWGEASAGAVCSR